MTKKKVEQIFHYHFGNEDGGEPNFVLSTINRSTEGSGRVYLRGNQT